ncbi:class I SAM-dependent methyltransferase [Thiovibrio sp. JS02]
MSTASRIREDRIYAHDRYTFFYEVELGRFREDLAFYLRHLPAAAGGVLELGCGTGRMSRELARAGHRLTGIDLSWAMLREASGRKEATTGPAPLYACMDMSRLAFSRPFAAAIAPYNTFNLLGSDEKIRRCLKEITPLLPSGGKLLLQLYVPDAELRELKGKKRFQFQIFDLPEGAKLIKEISKRCRPDSGLVEMEECYRLRFRKDLPDEDWRYSYTILGHGAEEWLRLFRDHGFTPTARYGTYALAPFCDGEHSLLLLALEKKA